jgi:hypothetical protein
MEGITLSVTSRFPGARAEESKPVSVFKHLLRTKGGMMPVGHRGQRMLLFSLTSTDFLTSDHKGQRPSSGLDPGLARCSRERREDINVSVSPLRFLPASALFPVTFGTSVQSPSAQSYVRSRISFGVSSNVGDLAIEIAGIAIDPWSGSCGVCIVDFVPGEIRLLATRLAKNEASDSNTAKCH